MRCLYVILPKLEGFLEGGTRRYPLKGKGCNMMAVTLVAIGTTHRTLVSVIETRTTSARTRTTTSVSVPLFQSCKKLIQGLLSTQWKRNPYPSKTKSDSVRWLSKENVTKAFLLDQGDDVPKTYNNLASTIYSFENLDSAFKEMSKGNEV